MEYFKQVEDLRHELLGLRSLTPDPIKISNLSIELCRNLLSDFKIHVKKNVFENQESEISFFRHYKQVPLENLIYHFEIKSFEVHFPKTNRALQKKHILKYQKKLGTYFTKNLDFVQYIEQGKTYLDDRYFTRAFFHEFNITHSKLYYRDPEFSSSHDVLLAKLNSNKRLIAYLSKRLDSLDRPLAPNFSANGKKLEWTASRTDMTELGYSLKKIGAINNGDISVKEIIHALETIFNFHSGDPYRNFSDIKMRKKSRTKFLDELSRGLLSDIDFGDA